MTTEKRFGELPKGMFSVDEPFEGDDLERDSYARTFARLAAGCDTPLVIGLYGTWGVGKSSLMVRIRHMLDEEDVPTVWFDPWQHQFDENPIVALLQTMVTQLKLDGKSDIKDLMMTVAIALSSPLLKATAGVTFKDLKGAADAVAEEGFRVRSEQVRLRESIGALIAKVRQESGRVVFFIDDLDRCLPANMIKMLEALKLYLNAAGCVYFLGIDHTTVQKAIEKEYSELAVAEQDYLDKIVQVPFLIPRIHEETAKSFIASLLPDDAKHCADYLSRFLGDNPRKVKRFANNLSLNLLMAPEIFEDQPDGFSVDLIVVMLLIQHRNELLWNRLSVDRDLYHRIRNTGDDAAAILTEYFDGDTQLQEMVQQIDCPAATPLDNYINLTSVVGASGREQGTLAIEPEMVEIPPGDFPMGSADDEDAAEDYEKPQHKVTIGYRFAIGRYPVTFDEYDAFCNATGRDQPSDRSWGRDRRPAINVSWDDAQAYVEWLSGETGRPYRLLSEAEWEYACRAGGTTRYSFGDDEVELGEHGWYGEISGGQTHPVGEKRANEFGLFDMHGNVWEWVEDVWHPTYDGAPDDGSAWIEGGEQTHRVLRGGSWFNRPWGVRSAIRDGDDTSFRFDFSGFRVARTLSR